MTNRVLRPLLVVEFLIALVAVYTAWSQVGGQYHLDLMHWGWKLGIGFGIAGLSTMLTAALAESEYSIPRRRVWLCLTGIVLLMVTAGLVTYYYHVNEPDEQDDDDQEEMTHTGAAFRGENGAVDYGKIVLNPRVSLYCGHAENCSQEFTSRNTLSGRTANPD